MGALCMGLVSVPAAAQATPEEPATAGEPPASLVQPILEAPNEPFGNYVAPTGAVASLSTIRAFALREAREAGDASPTSISVAGGSLRSALEVMSPHSMVAVPSGGPGQTAVLASSVYLVEIRGSFTLGNARIPRGEPPPQGTVLRLLLDAHTGELEGRSLATTPEEPIQALGTVRQIG